MRGTMRIEQILEDNRWKFSILISERDLPSDQEILDKIKKIEGLDPRDYPRTLARITEWISKLWPKSDSFIFPIDEGSLQAAATYFHEQVANLELGERHCDCEDPLCPHKARVSPLEIARIQAGAPAVRRLNLAFWEPFKYPILNLRETSVNDFSRLLAMVPDSAFVNFLRFSIEFKVKIQQIFQLGVEKIPQNAILKIPRYDIVEAIYFPETIPQKIYVSSNQARYVAIETSPDRRYYFLGFASQANYCEYGISWESDNTEIPVTIIAWFIQDDTIKRQIAGSKDFMVNYEAGRSENSFRFHNQGQYGAWEFLSQ